MAPLATEGQYLGDWLKFEEDNLYSRDQITVLAGSGSARELKSGAVLGRITASGKYIALVPGAADGSEIAAGVLALDATAPDGADVEATAILRHAIVAKQGLDFNGADTNETNIAIAQLETLGIRVRDGA